MFVDVVIARSRKPSATLMTVVAEVAGSVASLQHQCT
jgi:hypothetical protein